MPCTATARGTRQSAPHTSPLPFDDRIQNTPCGLKALLTVNGVNVTAESLCQNHWILKHGTQDYVLPVTREP